MARNLIGVVSSAKRDKTITVTVNSRETHPLYRKQYTKTRKYTAHDAKNEAGEGDKVEIAACRPFSKTKHYVLVAVVEKSHGKVNLKEGVTEVKHEAKVGADAAARAERAAQAAAEAEAEAEAAAKAKAEAKAVKADADTTDTDTAKEAKS